VHIDDTNSPKTESSSQIGRDIDKIGAKINEIDKTVEKTNDRVRDVKEVVVPKKDTTDIQIK